MFMRQVSCFIFLTAVILFSFCHSSFAQWVDVGGVVNVDPNESAVNPSLGGVGDTPYITFSELDSGIRQVYVKHWNGGDWEQDAGSLNINSSNHGFSPSIASVNGGLPFVTWRENESPWKIYVKKFNGSVWQQTGASYLNVDPVREAKSPQVLGVINTPYVVWDEYYDSMWRRVWVKTWNGASWNAQGAALNVNLNMSIGSPRMAVYNGTPWVAWQETTSSADSYIWVKRWNGASWEQVGASGVHNDNTKNPRNATIAFLGDTPFVGWQERVDTGMSRDQFFVKYWNGAAWTATGGSLLIDQNASMSYPCLVSSHNGLYASWTEERSGYEMNVKKWNGSQWNLVGQDIGTAGSIGTYYASMADVNDTLYATYMEADTDKVYVKKYLTPTPRPTRTVTPTITVSPTISPTATVTPTSALSSVDLKDKQVWAYPVPATEQVHFLMHLDEPRKVAIHIYNTIGERIAVLIEQLGQGRGQVMVWACDDASPGTYFVRVLMDGETVEKLKIVVVK